MPQNPRLKRPEEGHVEWLLRRVEEVEAGEGLTVAVFTELATMSVEVNLLEMDAAPGTTTRLPQGWNVSVGKDVQKLDPADIMDLMSKLVKTLEGSSVTHVGLKLCDGLDPQFVAQGLQVAAMRAGEFKTELPEYRGLVYVTILTSAEGAQEAVAEGLDLARTANVARWLGRLGYNQLNSAHFAELIQLSFEGKEGVTFTDTNSKDEPRLQLLHAVAKGSGLPGLLSAVQIDPPSGATTAVCWLGKAVMYDTGGICLKPNGGKGMCFDMSGAAAVFAALRRKLRRRLQMARSVLGVIGMAFNAIGPDSYLPDDVYMGYSGKSVEVDNTDAEGRLVLADGAAWADDLFDIAQVVLDCTLTGAGMIATGNNVTAVNLKEGQRQTARAAALTDVARECGDPIGVLPYNDREVKKALKSDNADMLNSGRGHRPAGCQQGYGFVYNHLPDDMDVIGVDIGGRVDSSSKGLPNPAGVWILLAIEDATAQGRLTVPGA